jgi:hypothetical protein
VPRPKRSAAARPAPAEPVLKSMGSFSLTDAPRTPKALADLGPFRMRILYRQVVTALAGTDPSDEKMNDFVRLPALARGALLTKELLQWDKQVGRIKRWQDVVARLDPIEEGED